MTSDYFGPAVNQTPEERLEFYLSAVEESYEYYRILVRRGYPDEAKQAREIWQIMRKDFFREIQEMINHASE